MGEWVGQLLDTEEKPTDVESMGTEVNSPPPVQLLPINTLGI